MSESKLPSAEDLDQHAQELEIAQQTGIITQQLLSPANTREYTDRSAPIRSFMWQPGQSGNPSGRPKKKPVTEIFEQILADPEKQEQVAASVFKLMTSGRMAAVMLLNSAADRLEGKISQPVEVSGELKLTLAQRMERSAKQLEEE